MIHTSCLRNVRGGRHHYATTCSCQMAVQTDLVLLHFWFRAVSPQSIRRSVCRIADAISTSNKLLAGVKNRSMCSESWPLHIPESSEFDSPYAFCRMYRDSLVATVAEKLNKTVCLKT
jgi:hypothetical protein